MIHLIQLPYSPFCLAIRRLLDYAGARYRVTNLTAASDRALIWRLTKQRYYQVPIIQDGRTVVFETNEDSQVVAKYLDTQLGLGLFPREWAGLQQVLWYYFEHEVEAVAFKLNDAHYRDWLPEPEWLPFLRHKERRFGRGCLDQWRQQQAPLQAELIYKLAPCEQLLLSKPFLLGPRPFFVDFNLYGILANYLYGGGQELPAAYPLLRDWYTRLTHAQLKRS